ncbi:hypothetical protein BA6E_10228 [Bacteroidales bacterium 6E]|nr:hypothetical protein BA6E_10228 [Bacteroidales bacterium 6E]
MDFISDGESFLIFTSFSLIIEHNLYHCIPYHFGMID